MARAAEHIGRGAICVARRCVENWQFGVILDLGPVSSMRLEVGSANLFNK